MVCGCCSCKSRYKLKVDNVYPPEDTNPNPVSDALEQLTYYALSNPDKLNKIGRYLSRRVRRDRDRNRIESVQVGMTTTDSLLQVCHMHLNLFIVHVLQTMETLLESSDQQYRLLATEAYVKYADIEEQTPAHLRRQEFFVDRFASMCYDESLKIRLAGLQGLRAMYRKHKNMHTWEEEHLNQLVPALLFNMESMDEADPEVEASSDGGGEEEEVPGRAAISALKELTSKIGFGNMKTLLQPVFDYLDQEQGEKWVGAFAQSVFRIILKSIHQQQLTHVAVGELVLHLDNKTEHPAASKAGIIKVLSLAVGMAAGGAVGPSVIEVFNTLLNHLRNSAEVPDDDGEERDFQDAIVASFGDFARHLFENQKVEVMTFIIGKIQTTRSAHSQLNLLKCTKEVARTLEAQSLSGNMPEALLEPLLDLFPHSDGGLRFECQEVFLELLQCPIDEDSARATATAPNVAFIREHRPRLHWHIFEALQAEPVMATNLRAINNTLLRLATFFGSDEAVECLKLVMAYQAHATEAMPLAQGFVFSFLLEFSKAWDLVKLERAVTVSMQNVSPSTHTALVSMGAGMDPSLTRSLSEQAEVATPFLFTPKVLAAAVSGSQFGPEDALLARLEAPYEHNQEKARPKHAPLRAHPTLRKIQGQPRAISHEVPEVQTAAVTFSTLKQALSETSGDKAHGKSLSKALGYLFSVAGSDYDRSHRLTELLAAPPAAVDAPPGSGGGPDPISPSLWGFELPVFRGLQTSCV